MDVNLEEALRLYTLAAEQGNADAQTSLGDCYGVSDTESCSANNIPDCILDAKGVGQEAEAVRWYRLAADQGHAEGQWNLGECYLVRTTECCCRTNLMHL